MNKTSKLILYVIHLYLLLPVIPVGATNANTEQWKRDVDTSIEQLNSDLIQLERYIIQGQTTEASQLSGSLNGRLQTMLEADYLYNKIIMIRRDEPSYTPNHVNDLEIALDQDFGEIARQMSEGIENAKQAIQDAKNNIGKQKALTWYITFMTAMKVAFDVNGMLSSTSLRNLVITISTNTDSDAFWEYSDADYIRARWDVHDVKVATQQAIIIEQDRIVAETMDKLNQLSKIETSVFAIHGQIEIIKNNIVRVNAHIDAATNVDIPGLADAAGFDDDEYKKALDANLDNVLDEYITWIDYNATKKSIKLAATEQYELTLEKLIETNQDTIPYTRSYNEFESYYETFDDNYIETRKNIVNTYNSKINAWQKAVEDLLTGYGAINFDDYAPVHMIPITVEIPDINILDDSQRQITYGPSFTGSFTAHTLLQPCANGEYSWYDSLLIYPQVINQDTRRLHNLVNAARESEAIYEDSTGIATWTNTGFSTLFSDEMDSLDASENLDDLYDYLEGFDRYALSKTDEAQEIINELDDVLAKQEDVESYLSTINRAYLPQEEANSHGVYVPTSKIPDTYGGSITLSETESLCEYIEKDLTNFIYQASDLSTINNDARTNIRSLYEYEVEKYDFIITVDNDANELVEKLEPYSDLVSMLNDFRDVYKGYLGGIEGSDNLATQEYLQEQMTAISGYTGLQEFIDLQREVNEMTGYIKPVRGARRVYGGFRGNFSVLESDREIVAQLRELEYVPSGDISLNEIEQGFPNVHNILDQEYSDIVDAMAHIEYMSALAEQMDWFVFELDLYSEKDKVEYIQFSKAFPIWKQKVLPRYDQTNGFEEDPANRQLYEQIKLDFTTIFNAHKTREEEKRQEAQETLRRVEEEGLSSYYIPEMYLVPNVEIFPDEDLKDPMLAVIFNLYNEEELTEYGLEKYLDEWNSYWEAENKRRESEQEQEEYEELIQRSIEDGIDYLNPDEEGFCYYLNCTSDPEFWLEKSIEDGLDYFNRNPDGTYPPYTGDGELTDDMINNYEGESYTMNVTEFRSRVGESMFNELDLGNVTNIHYSEEYDGSSYLISSEKSGKILGVFPVTLHKKPWMEKPMR